MLLPFLWRGGAQDHIIAIPTWLLPLTLRYLVEMLTLHNYMFELYMRKQM